MVFNLRSVMRSKNFPLFGYFVLLIMGGALLLLLPGSWKGSGELSFADALFTATSAACVTGLITVDTAQFSLFGQMVILLLIQAGGLGILTFTSVYLLFPGNKISFRDRSLILDYYVEGMETDPLKIIKMILTLTLSLEILGALILFPQFMGEKNSFFTSLFLAVSAFCNAGFSVFSDSVIGVNNNPVVLLTLAALLILGGLSFSVIHEILRRSLGQKRQFSLHSRIVIFMTLGLIILGLAGYFLFEKNGVLKPFTGLQKIYNLFFLAVTPRTAGFNNIPMEALSGEAQVLTIFLMFIGGAPGSIAGGIKVTTIFLVFLLLFRGLDEQGEIRVGNRRLKSRTLVHALIFGAKAFFLLFVSVMALVISEQELISSGRFTLLEILFESVSAFATVGLSRGLTAYLSESGKIIIIITMFAGRIGLVTMALVSGGRRVDGLVKVPTEEVMIG